MFGVKATLPLYNGQGSSRKSMAVPLALALIGVFCITLMAVVSFSGRAAPVTAVNTPNSEALLNEFFVEYDFNSAVFNPAAPTGTATAGSDGTVTDAGIPIANPTAGSPNSPTTTGTGSGPVVTGGPATTGTQITDAPKAEVVANNGTNSSGSGVNTLALGLGLGGAAIVCAAGFMAYKMRKGETASPYGNGISSTDVPPARNSVFDLNAIREAFHLSTVPREAEVNQMWSSGDIHSVVAPASKTHIV
eukprot:Colp12_sorted_trinity150504_noHs@8641